MANQIALILGTGKRVGAATAAAFAAKGFKVAVVSRSITPEDYPSHLVIPADLAEPGSVEDVFKKVKEALGEPNVVIYNAVYWAPSEKHMLDTSLDVIKTSFNVNAVTPIHALQLAVEGFSRLPEGSLKAFLFTGNKLNEGVLTKFWVMGAPKSAVAHVVIAAAKNYKDAGVRVHYVDERTDDGGPVYGAVDGEAHAKAFVALTEGKDYPPLITFTPAKGITEFPKSFMRVIDL